MSMLKWRRDAAHTNNVEWIRLKKPLKLKVGQPSAWEDRSCSDFQSEVLHYLEEGATKAAELNLQPQHGEVHLDNVLDEARPRLRPAVELIPALARGRKVGQAKTKQRTTDVSPRSPPHPSRAVHHQVSHSGRRRSRSRSRSPRRHTRSRSRSRSRSPRPHRRSHSRSRSQSPVKPWPLLRFLQERAKQDWEQILTYQNPDRLGSWLNDRFDNFLARNK